MLGLSTHDAGGCLAGRTPSDRFGLKWLRADLPLEEDYVVTSSRASTSSPRSSKTLSAAKPSPTPSNWDRVDALRGFGGIRIEDDVRVTATARGAERRHPEIRRRNRSHPAGGALRMTRPLEQHHPRRCGPATSAGHGRPRGTRLHAGRQGITYLFSEEGNLVRSLWRYDIATGERRVLAGPPPASTAGRASCRARRSCAASAPACANWA